MGKVKQGGTFASVTGAPANAGKYPQVRTVAFVSKQDTKNLEYTVEAVRAGKLTDPDWKQIASSTTPRRRMPRLRKGSAGKILLLP